MIKQLAIFTLMLSGAANASLIVSETNDGATLVNSIIGAGVTVSNISVVGTASQSGTFTDGLSSGIGIDQGVILTSGSASAATGPNSSTSTGSSTGTGGDLDLAGLVTQTINDANVLQFDFTTTTGELFFDYVFASEEYNEFVDSSYNDVFGLFVDGVNIATAPDGQAVSINNVNCGNPYSGTGPNCDYFNNNEGGAFDIEYDGFTNVFQASIDGLIAGETYTMKFAIADAGDSNLDSAIIIGADSFSGTTPNPVPEPSTIALFGLGLLGFGFSRKRTTKAN